MTVFDPGFTLVTVPSGLFPGFRFPFPIQLAFEFLVFCSVFLPCSCTLPPPALHHSIFTPVVHHGPPKVIAILGTRFLGETLCPERRGNRDGWLLQFSPSVLATPSPAGEALAQWPRRCFCLFFTKREHKILELSTLVDGMRLNFRSVLPASLPWRRRRVVSLHGIPSQAPDSKQLAPGTERKELLRRWFFALELD